MLGLSLEPAWLQVYLAVAGMISTFGFFIYMIRMQQGLLSNVLKKITPVVKNVMTTMGAKGNDSKELAEFEGGIMEDLLNKGLPELSLLQEFGIITDERMAWIKENPEGMMVLVERWLPVAQKILKMRGGKGFDQQTQKYDF